MRLLLVEDERDIQSFLRQALAEAGYRVDVSPDARTAESLAAGNPYDILIVDHMRQQSAVYRYDFAVDGRSTAGLPRETPPAPYRI